MPLPPQIGFNPAVVERLCHESKNFNEHQKYSVLLYDEMKIKDDLVWNKHSGELIGYVNLGDPDVNFATLEKLDDIATHMLSFMVRGLCSNLKFSIGYFATRTLMSSQLFVLFWQAVSILEITCNLYIVAATGDGASINRRFINMHAGLSHNLTSDVVYRTKNLFAFESRYIYFFSDAPHLVKTSRNCLRNSGSGSCSRFMWNNDHMLWSHISALYYADLENGLHLLPKLTDAHINLNSFSVMRVDLATQVLSGTVAAVLKSFGPSDAKATALFCEMMDKFFDCFNCRNFNEEKKKRKPFLMPYTDKLDFRFDWLQNEFLAYFEDWKAKINVRPGPYTSNDRARMFISSQTYNGIKISVYSLVEVTQYLLNTGMDFVLSNKFCQDPLEEYFGKQRSMGRCSDNPTVERFGYNSNKVRINRSNQAIQGNTRGQNFHKVQRWHEVEDDPLPMKKKK